MRTKCVTLSITDIAADCLLSKETVKRTMKWLADEEIIQVVRKGGKTNTYMVVYKETRVTHDPSVGSPMTLVDDLDLPTRVTHDPSEVVKNMLLAGSLQIHNRIVLETSIKKNDREIACGDHEGESMIIGADTERAPTPEPRKKFKETDELVRRFIYSKQFCMRTFTTTDINIVRRACKLMLQSGLTPDTIREMIDTFVNDTRFTEYNNPATAFASKKIQAVLLERVTVKVVDDDPVIMLMVNDFVRSDNLAIEWDPQHDTQLRKAILTRCLEGLYRYPEVVASIARHWPGDFQNQEFLNALSALESMIKFGLGKETIDMPEVLGRLSFVDLPKTLIDGTPRDSAGTLAGAAYTTRRQQRV